VSGRYRIDRLIGAGGSAEVYAASVLGAGGFMRRVALKRLKAELAREPEWVAEFEAEARLASRLHHANVVAVLDYGTLDGRPFQVLEYVDGVDLLGLEAEARAQGVALPAALWLAVLAEARARARLRARRARRGRTPAGPGAPRRHARQHPGGLDRRREAGRLRHRVLARALASTPAWAW
jgi:hypothetical protein